MSEPIKAGDLVVVILPAPCCGNRGPVGKIGTVGRMNRNPTVCGACLRVTQGDLVAEILPFGRFCEVSRLKRIDPLPEDEREPREERITA